MNVKRLLGLDTQADRYAYGVDPEMGYVSSRKIPDRWVSTTCGYCSVGCGMLAGVKDGRMVTVRTFLNRIEAELALSALEAAGIEAVMLRDDCGGVRPSLWLTGVDLLVRPEDFRRATDVLDLPALQRVEIREA